MSQVKILASGVVRIESDAVHFLNQASEQRTLALHSRHPEARKKHLHNAERYEKQVRMIANREQRICLSRSLDEGAHF